MDPVHDVLKTEAAELNNYVRTMIQTSLTYFAFFITITFTVFALSLKVAFENESTLMKGGPVYEAVYVSYALLALHIVATVVGLLFVRADAKRASKRIDEIQMAIAEGKSLLPRSPVPQSIERALGLMTISLLCFLIIFGVVTAAVLKMDLTSAKGPPVSTPSARPASTTR